MTRPQAATDSGVDLDPASQTSWREAIQISILHEAKPMLKLVRWADIETEHLNPQLERQFISTDGVTLARFLLRKGVVVPQHNHPNEQLAYVIQGALKFTIDGKEMIVRTGEVLCIPPNVPHMAEALEDTIDLDVFVPSRTDWASAGDAYLRQQNKA